MADRLFSLIALSRTFVADMHWIGDAQKPLLLLLLMLGDPSDEMKLLGSRNLVKGGTEVIS